MFTAKWCKGSQNDVPDALSCNPQDMHAEYDATSQPEMSIQPSLIMAKKVPMLKTYLNMLRMMNSCVTSSSMAFQNIVHNYQIVHDEWYWHTHQHITLDGNLCPYPNQHAQAGVIPAT